MKDALLRPVTFFFALFLFFATSPLLSAQAQLQKVTYDLEAQSNDGAFPNGVDATATFWELNDFQTAVTLEFDDGPTEANVAHPAHIHEGEAGTGGGISVWLTPIDGSRDSTSARVINQPFDSLETFDGYINIHESVENLGNVVSQGNIGANADSTTEDGLTVVDNPRAVEYDLPPNPNNGSFPDGVPATATFQEVTSGMTLVTLDLDIDGATDASVSHPAHIHNNSADEGGGIVYGLGPISGNDPNSRSSMLVPESFDNLTGFDGYINIHESVSNLGDVVSQGNIGANADPVPVSIAKARAEDRTSLYNYEVTLQGTVSRAFGSYARIQDNSGPPNGDGPTGISIRQTSGSNASDFQSDISVGNIQPGTELQVTGTPSQFSGLVQVNNDDLASYTIVDTMGTEPSPQQVSLTDIGAPDGEDYESVLIEVDGLSFPDSTAGGTFEGSRTYYVQDGNGNDFMFRVQDNQETALIGENIPTGTFTYEGVLGQFNVFSGRDDDSGYQLIPVRPATALPVEFADFGAVRNGNSVELTWQTASETNNAGFTVQRETESGWTSLDFVESKVTGGTTTETTSYRYTVDQELDPGTHRFRLQQKDLDGTTSLSDVVTVDVGLDEAVSLSAPAPNPTAGTATLEFGVTEATEVTVSVYNVLGQRVQTLYQGTPQADQVRDVTVDASTLSSGVYFVRMQADGQTRTERLTVVR